MAMQPFPDVLTIENLPAAVSEQTLTKLFEPFGAVEYVLPRYSIVYYSILIV